jgi:hypothetical protein
MEEDLPVHLKLAWFRTDQHAEDLPKYTIGPEIEIESTNSKFEATPARGGGFNIISAEVSYVFGESLIPQ